MNAGVRVVVRCDVEWKMTERMLKGKGEVSLVCSG